MQDYLEGGLVVTASLLCRKDIFGAGEGGELIGNGIFWREETGRKNANDVRHVRDVIGGISY